MLHPKVIGQYQYGLNDRDWFRADVKGQSVGDCLNNFIFRYPYMKKRLYETNGELKFGTFILLNGQSDFPRSLSQPVSEGDVIRIYTLALEG